MKLKSLLVVTLLTIGLFSCVSEDPVEPIVGTWDWASGSREISPTGFERLHKDRSATYLVNDAEFQYVFEEDGSFVNTFSPPGKATTTIQGTWNIAGDFLNLDVTEPVNFGGITRYQLPNSDESNLNLQWSVQYLEFSDAQNEQWKAEGFIIPEGWTVDRDSLLQVAGTEITSTITLHFEKI